MEFTTERLTSAQLEQEVDNILNFLRSKHKNDLVVSYGWGCDLEMDALYQEKRLPLSELHDFIEQSIQSGIFVLGESDLAIDSQDRKLGFILCHESDIHVTAEDSEVAKEMAAAWASRGYTCYEISSMR